MPKASRPQWWGWGCTWMLPQSPCLRLRSPQMCRDAKVRLLSLSFDWGPQGARQNNNGKFSLLPHSGRADCGADPWGVSPSPRAQREAARESPRPRGSGRCWSQAWETSRSAGAGCVDGCVEQHWPKPAASRAGEPAWSYPKGPPQGLAAGAGWAPTRAEGQEPRLKEGMMRGHS